MPKKNKPKTAPKDNDPRLNPEQRLVPSFDSETIKKFEAPTQKMGVRVVDHFAEEHMM